MPIHMQRAVPVLASLDLDRTVDFYENKLGFKTVANYDGYVIFERDDINIHYGTCEDRYIAENTSCYVFVTGIETLYEEYQAQQVIHPNGALEEKFYDVYEFSILDPDGNLIKFGEPIAHHDD